MILRMYAILLNGLLISLVGPSARRAATTPAGGAATGGVRSTAISRDG